MTDQGERYDRIAAGYAQWWAPVLEARAVALLDWVDDAVRAGARRMLDIGTGTGTLARAALRRWPAVEVTAVDLSAGMISASEAEADKQLSRDERRRLRSTVAPADSMPFDDGSFDVAISSFVLQLVPNRYRALREAHRVLVPGGTLAYVTWLVDDRIFRPDVEFDAVLDEIGIGAREQEDRPGDVPTGAGAAMQLRRAGFRDVTVEEAVLDHRFGVEGYVRFLSEFDEEDLISELSRKERDQVLSRLRERLERLPPDDLVMRYPIVYARGVRSA
jgi:SAM-dependent methyltransferase